MRGEIHGYRRIDPFAYPFCTPCCCCSAAFFTLAQSAIITLRDAELKRLCEEGVPKALRVKAVTAKPPGVLKAPPNSAFSAAPC